MTTKRCKECLLPENYPGIRFNEVGVCNYCHDYKKRQYFGEEELKKNIESSRNKKSKYDCIVGISGGRDSAYTLYYLVKVCNLRVLAFMADNGFIPEQSRLNVKNMTDILGVDLIIEEHNLLKKCIKHIVKSWVRKPSPAMIGFICLGCKFAIDRGLFKTAKKYKTPLIITGASGFEGLSFKRKLLEIKLNNKNRNLSFAYGLVSEVIKNPFYILSPTCLITCIKEYTFHYPPFFIISPSPSKTRKIIYPNLKVIFLFDYIEWNEEKILSTINDKLKWRKYIHSESSWRSDCKVSLLKDYLFLETIGFTKKDDQLSEMIREHVITREKALERLTKENVIPQQVITEIFDELQLNFADLLVALKNYKKEKRYK